MKEFLDPSSYECLRTAKKHEKLRLKKPMTWSSFESRTFRLLLSSGTAIFSRSAKRPTDQPIDRPTDRLTNRPNDQSTNRPTKRSTDQITDRQKALPTDQPPKRPTKEQTDQPSNQEKWRGAVFFL